MAKCKRVCIDRLGGTRSFLTHRKHESMFTLGYCYCEECELFFKKYNQTNPENGKAKACRCCGHNLRYRAKSTTNRLSIITVAIRDSKRY